jgi:hypothetical protein
MKAILRNRKTGLYYARCDQWVTDPSRALDFDNIEHPGQFVVEEGTAGLEVVLVGEDSPWELALPVRLAWPRRKLARIAAWRAVRHNCRHPG